MEQATRTRTIGVKETGDERMMSIYSYPYIIDLLTGGNVKEFKNGYYEARYRFPEELIREIEPQLTSLRKECSESQPMSKWVSLPGATKIMLKSLRQFDLQNDNIIKRYIGNYNVDICYLFGTKYGSDHRNSQQWHHDSVGKRLKLFFVFEPDVNPTLYIEKSSGYSRIFKPVLSKKDRISYVPKHEISKIGFRPDMGYFVDTNYMHAGVKGQSGQSRVAFVCEISNRLKRFSRGRVGPRADP
tara:strand:+ start:51 stop:779 length:729 start_codon:yes stop_codon:yes gene_type:complete